MVRHAPIHRRSGHSDIAICCGRNVLGSSPSTYGGAPLESGHHFESQTIQRIQNVFGRTLSIIDSSIATALEADLAINPSQVSFNNGTFSVATASPDAHDVYRWAVPGHEYFFAYYDGNIHATDDSGHVTTFK